MGNRCVITQKDSKIGIYLHWNGGRSSVEAFLQVAKDYQIINNGDYSNARLCQIICNYFGGKLCVGVDILEELDLTGDNGTYVINDQFDIIDRINLPYKDFEEECDNDKYQSVYNDCLKNNDQFFKDAEGNLKH